jgi:hypothetical protein
MRPETKKKGKERGPSKMKDLLEGKYECLKVVEVQPVKEMKVDINDAL